MRRQCPTRYVVFAKQVMLTEQERDALQSSLDRAYNLTAELLADLALNRPQLMPVCFITSILITIIHDHVLQEEEKQGN